MSAETLAIVISAATLLLAFFSAFGWMVRRTDAQFERSDGRLSTVERTVGDRIDRVETTLGDRIDRVETTLGDRIDRVERELVEVKIAVARIEGPPRRLMPTR